MLALVAAVLMVGASTVGSVLIGNDRVTLFAGL
jgi:hypothetical protein